MVWLSFLRSVPITLRRKPLREPRSIFCDRRRPLPRYMQVFGRVEDWRAGLGRCLCSLLSRPFVCECHSISTMPRFPSPPRRAQRADCKMIAEHMRELDHYGVQRADASRHCALSSVGEQGSHCSPWAPAFDRRNVPRRGRSEKLEGGLGPRRPIARALPKLSKTLEGKHWDFEIRIDLGRLTSRNLRSPSSVPARPAPDRRASSASMAKRFGMR